MLFVLRFCVFFFQAEDGIRDLVRSRGLGDVYKRQVLDGDVAGHGRRCSRKDPVLIVAEHAMAHGEVLALSLIHI